MEASRVDPVLGSLAFNVELNWYEGRYRTAAHGEVPFAISLDATPSVEAALHDARELIPRLAEALAAAQAYACDQLLALKNEVWLEEGEGPVTAADFRARLTIDSIGVYANRKAEFFFRDGGLFWGHTVLLSWSESQGFVSADIAG
ncbi:MAG TPA: DUF2262 domain-containing protein [Anaerolineae bacterium]|nr:DUF2262 domain-containing protein [Anaerolineae bacterium]